MIPRKIYQTVSRTTELHPQFLENIAKIQSVNPDWDYELYDDISRREFIRRYYGKEYLASYDKIRPEYGAARADFFRYLIIYKLGGVYIDLKSSTTRALSETIRKNDEYILSHWDQSEFPGWGKWLHYGVENEFQQWHIIARPEHPYLKDVIDRVKFNIDHYDPLRNGVGREAVLLTTGPIPYSRVINQMKCKKLHREVNACRDLGLKFSFLLDSNIDHSKLMPSRYRKQRTALTCSDQNPARVVLARINRKLRFRSLNEAYELRGHATL